MDNSIADRILFLTSDPPSLSAHSGYSLLTQYLQATTTRRVVRRNAVSFPDRLIRYACSRLAANRTYQLTSLRLEWQAYRQLRSKRFRAAHLLWADSDWGYLGVAHRRKEYALFGTFHHCSDTLPTVMQHPSRLAALDLCVLMSETQRPFFLAHGISPDRIRVVLHGVDTDFFRPGLQGKRQPFTVLSVGAYRRNFVHLRDLCVAMANDSGIILHLVIPKAFHSVFDGMAHVRCFSGLTDQELLVQYQEASCFLMTCENATANNSILEAMACGLPIVAERVGGLPEYAAPDGTLFAPSGSIAELRTHILDLHSSNAASEAMGIASRARAETLSWPCVADTMLTLYKTVLG